MSTTAKPTGPESCLLTELPKRKRGRPRKQSQEPAGPMPPKNPRGRPKGSKKPSANSGQEICTSAEKRPRGRPRKWFIVQEKGYQKPCVQGSSNPSASTLLAMEGTSGKGCCKMTRTTEFKRPLNTPSAEVQQQTAS